MSYLCYHNLVITILQQSITKDPILWLQEGSPRSVVKSIQKMELHSSVIKAPKQKGAP